MQSKILIISFSLRDNSQSQKVAEYIQSIGGKNYNYLDLFENPLPFWDEGVWNNDPKWQDLLNPIKAMINEADGFVLVVPEYGGSPSPSYFNFMLIFGSILNHKPALITTVSNARGGAYPISSIRSSGYKNTKINFVPDQLIIRNVESVLNQEVDNSNQEDVYIRQRIEYTLKILDVYTTNFVNIRSQLQLDPKYGNGM